MQILLQTGQQERTSVYLEHEDDRDITMKNLPAEVSKYATSPVFTEETMPGNLMKSHRTKPKTWAKIVVLEGTLRYRILEPALEETDLTSSKNGVVEPAVPHEVEAIGKVRFYLDFYR